MSVTMKDVAARAKVSLSAVSQALRNKGTLAPETRKRIIAIAEEMGYVPPIQDKQLRIAMLCCYGRISASEVYHGFYEGAKSVLGDMISIVAAAPSADSFPISSIVNGIEEVDGVIFFGGEVNHPVLQAILGLNLKCVVINRESTDSRLSTVSFANRDAFRQATMHLLQHGYKDLGYLYIEPMASWSRMRLQGCKDAIAQVGGRLLEIGISQVDALIPALERAVKDVRAILAENDVIAMDAIKCLHQMQVQVPEEIAVFGCDDLSLGSRFEPALSTISVPAHRMGKIAGNLLKGLLSGQLSHGHITVPGRLILRSSCGCNLVDP